MLIFFKDSLFWILFLYFEDSLEKGCSMGSVQLSQLITTRFWVSAQNDSPNPFDVSQISQCWMTRRMLASFFVVQTKLDNEQIISCFEKNPLLTLVCASNRFFKLQRSRTVVFERNILNVKMMMQLDFDEPLQFYRNVNQFYINVLEIIV